MVAEIEELYRQQARLLREIDQKERKLTQDLCPHLAGSHPLSEMHDPAGHTSIVWHKHKNQEVWGVCSNCLRLLKTDDPDYWDWFNKPSLNRMSAAGVESQMTDEDKEEVDTHGFGGFQEFCPDYPVQKIDDSSKDPSFWSKEKFNAALLEQREQYKAARKFAKDNPYVSVRRF